MGVSWWHPAGDWRPSSFRLHVRNKWPSGLRPDRTYPLSAGAPNRPRPALQPTSWLSTLCLSAVIVGTLIDIVFARAWVTAVTALFLLTYLGIEWMRLVFISRLLLIVSAALAVLVILRFDMTLLLTGARRMILLPAFLAVLSLLRAAATMSPAVAAAGRHLVNQPPSRRYIALVIGGNLFGVLLNIGGLVLLLDMIKQANTLEAAGGDRAIVAWRERRMTVAALRGFSAIPLWSPLGIALNLILAIVGITWTDVAPAALLATLGFTALGWMLDLLAAPKGLRVAARSREPRGGWAVFQVVGHVAALFLITLAGELAFDVAFQTVLMFAVPLYAIGWLLAQNIRNQRKRPLRSSVYELYRRGVAQFPFFANETAAFAASGFLGLVLAVIVPRAPVQAALTAIAAGPGVIAAGLALIVFVLAGFGLNPVISVSILAGTVSAVGMPGLSPQLLALALGGAWACTVGFGPWQPSMILTANLLGRTPKEIGLIWNGPYALSAITLWMLVLVFAPL